MSAFQSLSSIQQVCEFYCGNPELYHEDTIYAAKELLNFVASLQDNMVFLKQQFGMKHVEALVRSAESLYSSIPVIYVETAAA